MHFKSPKVEDCALFKKFDFANEFSCENTFLNHFMWAGKYNYQFATFCEDTLVFRISDRGEMFYFLPIGNHFFEAIEEILNSYGNDVSFCAAEGSALEKLRKRYGDKLTLILIENNFEYIYNSQDLALLSGKKYHQKRNHISAFTRTYNWRFEPLSDNNISDIKVITENWIKERGTELDNELLTEIEAINLVVENYKSLSLLGGIIYVDNVPVAYTFGDEINDSVFDVTTEKALAEYPGAYTVINNEFAKQFLYPKYRYVNREDDLGIDGLRKAKHSYHPEILLKKYIIKIKNAL